MKLVDLILLLLAFAAGALIAAGVVLFWVAEGRIGYGGPF